MICGLDAVATLFGCHEAACEMKNAPRIRIVTVLRTRGTAD